MQTSSHTGSRGSHPLRQARERERYTLRQLAERVGLTHTRIWEIEHGARPSPIESRLLRAALGVPLSALGDHSEG